MIRRLIIFVGGTLAFWLVVALVVRQVWSTEAALASAVAAAICLVPAALTLAWSSWAMTQTPEMQVTAVLGGTGVRLLTVAGIAFLLYQRLEFLRDENGYWIWVLVFYFFTLALEVGLVLRRPTPAKG